MQYDVVLTVGSTSFSPLVRAFLAPASLAVLEAAGHSHVFAQVGQSALPLPFVEGQQRHSRLALDIQRFTDDLETLVGQASLVVSHAGAGSILSFLRPDPELPMVDGRTLVLVPNSTLMDSHQSDLADEMAAQGWATVCSPDTLAATLAGLASSAKGAPSTCPPFDGTKLARILDSTIGFV